MKQEITAELQQAFDGDLKDAVQDFTITRRLRTVSDDDWLINGSSADDVLEYTGRGVFGGYYQHLIDNQTILSDDVRLVALQDDLDELPQINDEILWDNQVFRVVNIKKDPANVSITAQLRRV